MERMHRIITVIRDILFVIGFLCRVYNAVERHLNRKVLEARGYERSGSSYKGTTIGFTKQR